MKKILVALAMVALVAMPAFASVQNIKVGGSVDNTYIHRENFDLGKNVIGDEIQDVMISQVSLKVDAELTDNVSAVVKLINERAWGVEDASDTNADIDINLAYVTLKEMLYSPLTVMVGRQSWAHGNSFVFDTTGPNNQATGALSSIAQDLTQRSALDAVRAVLDYNPLTIDTFFAKVDSRSVNAAADDDDDVDLYGTNFNYKLGDDKQTEVEAYFFAKIDKGTGSAAANKQNKADTIYTPGLRASTNPIKGLNVQGEVAWQAGNKVVSTTSTGQNIRREAMGAQAIANYQVPLEATKQWNPVVTGVYTYVSGDKNAGDVNYSKQASANKWTAWDPMFENQASGTIYNTMFDLTNAHIYSTGVQVNPMEDVTAKVTWTGMWLDREFQGSSPSYSLRRSDDSSTNNSLSAIADESEIGQEIDAGLTYDYTEDVQIGANLGWFIPGDSFAASNDSTASQALVNVNVAF